MRQAMKILCANRNRIILFLVCVFLLGSSGLIACTRPVPAPPPTPSPTPPPSTTPSPTPAPAPTPGPTSTPPLTEEWSADGIIKVREYHGSNNYGDYTIHWRSDEQYIYVGMTAKTDGWVAMALQPGSRMKDADMVFGFVSNGETAVFDLFSTGDFGPHPPDTELGGTNDILEFAGSEQTGFTTIEFKRKLISGDRYDNPLSKGTNKIIWSYGPVDDLSHKHTDRGYGVINL